MASVEESQRFLDLLVFVLCSGLSAENPIEPGMANAGMPADKAWQNLEGSVRRILQVAKERQQIGLDGIRQSRG